MATYASQPNQKKSKKSSKGNEQQGKELGASTHLINLGRPSAHRLIGGKPSLEGCGPPCLGAGTTERGGRIGRRARQKEESIPAERVGLGSAAP